LNPTAFTDGSRGLRGGIFVDLRECLSDSFRTGLRRCKMFKPFSEIAWHRGTISVNKNSGPRDSNLTGAKKTLIWRVETEQWLPIGYNEKPTPTILDCADYYGELIVTARDLSQRCGTLGTNSVNQIFDGCVVWDR
jgi:hypothetical protein